MQLRTVLFCSFLALPALAACGDDTGGGTGGDGSTSGSSSTGTGSTTAPASNSSSAAGTGGDPSGGTGGDPSGGTGGGTGGGNALSCDTYCETIMGACDGEPDAPQQYPDMESCMRSCGTLQAGEYQDPEASLGCHQYHADAAAADPATHCGHAGPQGGDQCGTPCENFCQIAAGLCPDVYASTDVCMKVCPDFEEGTFSVDPPATGDTLGCRIYHLTVAAISDVEAAVHCPHTAADSDQCL